MIRNLDLFTKLTSNTVGYIQGQHPGLYRQLYEPKGLPQGPKHTPPQGPEKGAGYMKPATWQSQGPQAMGTRFCLTFSSHSVVGSHWFTGALPHGQDIFNFFAMNFLLKFSYQMNEWVLCSSFFMDKSVP